MALDLTLENLKRETEKLLSPFQVLPGVKICRYMDFVKFMSLLQNRSLYFSRADKFEDLEEGGVPEKNLKQYLNMYGFLMKDDKGIFDNLTMEEKKDKLLERYMEQRRRTYISCWNKFESESYALWKIYAPNQGVCIQTTVGKLNETIELYDGEVYKVVYLKEKDKSTHITVPRFKNKKNVFDMHSENFFVLKKQAYSYENEIRALIYENDIIRAGEEEGKTIEIGDLSTFIERIYISPFAEKWFIKLVKDICGKYNIKDCISKSDIQVK